jgi:hypothetical protein
LIIGGYVNSLQKTGLTLTTDGMSRSRKKFPAGVVCGCKSQKRGKQVASKRFRRRVRILMRLRKYERLPYRSTELTSPWDLGGDGKCFYGYHPDKEWYARIMRK